MQPCKWSGAADMSIDWVTVLAQLANFLLLMWLLRRFLFRPILAGIDAREAEIARRLSAADEARVQAEAAEERYQELYRQTLVSQEERVAEALEATRQERSQLLAEGRERLESEQRQWRRHLEQEEQDFMARLQAAGAAALLELTRKALHELADQELELAMLRQLEPRLKPVAAELRAAGGGQPATVTTRDPLPEPVARSLRQQLTALLPGVALDFVVDGAQSPGLIIQAGGARLMWPMDAYVDELKQRLARGDRQVATVGEGRGCNPRPNRCR